MLAADNLGISFGGRRLFGGLNFTLRAGERFSLAGPNGAGKSTVMKIIAGLEHPDEGRIAKAKTITVGYLPQEGVQIKGRTLMAEAETAFADALDLQREFDEVSERLGVLAYDSQEYADALEAFGDLQLRLEHHDVSRMKPQIEVVLTGLGFSLKDMDRLTDEFELVCAGRLERNQVLHELVQGRLVIDAIIRANHVASEIDLHDCILRRALRRDCLPSILVLQVDRWVQTI
ncbi:MAG: ATP-binding cassette domain-containing protein [Roseimicrobium sp.]